MDVAGKNHSTAAEIISARSLWALAEFTSPRKLKQNSPHNSPARQDDPANRRLPPACAASCSSTLAPASDPRFCRRYVRAPALTSLVKNKAAIGGDAPEADPETPATPW